MRRDTELKPHNLTLSQALPLNHNQATLGKLFPFAGLGFLCKMETIMDTCLFYPAMIVYRVTRESAF